MFGRSVIPQRVQEEGEKPFWISYADLMTALMMLFLVVMVVSLVVITNPGPAKAHQARQQNFCNEIKNAAKGIEGVTVDCENNRVDFGRQAEFKNDEYGLEEDTKRKLRQFIPKVYYVVNHTGGKPILKRVDIEGYASNTGKYLHNLQLSMRRAESVLCSLFEPPTPNEIPLTEVEKLMIRDLFLVGGYSFNNSKTLDQDQMRRVEFRLQYYGLQDEPKSQETDASMSDFGMCKNVSL